MNRLAILGLLAACGSEPEGRAVWPVDVIEPILANAKIDALAARSDALLAKFKRDNAKYDVTGATTKVATLVAGWNTVPVTEYPTSFWGLWADGNEVLAGGFQNWLVASSDGGASWRRLDTHALAGGGEKDPLISKVWASGDHRVVIGFENDLVGVSHDRGATWERIALPFPDGPEEGANDPRALWGAGKDVYLSTEPGTFGKEMFLFVSHDAGATWKLALRLPAHGAHPSLVEIAGSRDGSDVYAAGWDDGRALLFHTRDRGGHWQPVHVPAGVDGANTVAVAGPGDVYVHFSIPDGGDNTHRDHTIAHSRDGGATWSRIQVEYLGPAADIAGENWWEPNEVAVAPDHAIYAALHGRRTAMLESSRDGGKTWTVDLAEDQPDAIAFGAGQVYATLHDPAIAILKPR